MTATTVTTTPWYLRPEPMPFDFVGTPRFVEKLAIIKKDEGISLPGSAQFSNGIGYGKPAYFIFFLTPFGDMRMTVSKEVFDLLEVGDKIVVNYRKGRWTGALKGVIAR